ncbi:MAG: hypothetical protein J6D08_04120 [Lachnospiraceae bacterium]|nr:hypothetical protein [Lachnospiraceae bacterium]
MKKGLALMLGILMVLSLTACGAEPSGSEETETLRDSGSVVMEEETADTVPETSEPVETSAEENSSNILIVYFSRWGNTEYPDDVDATTSASIVVDENGRYGTTEYVANLIQQTVGGDIHLIETVTPYTEDFDELRDVNHSEMAEDYLPALVESNLDISGYDTVFIGYPVWATAVPQAVLSFLNEYDLSGKTVIPFCTHDGYGAGSSYNTIREASHAAESLEGLAIEAKDVPAAENTVAAWLERIVITGESAGTENTETAITITIGDIVLDGVIYDTALAQEIKEYFPLTISMSGFGGREYYGGVDFYPAEENLVGGGNTFNNGDITYCEAHHNMAIFYAQTDNPVLSVDVIPIGRVTSDLSVFENLDSREEITFSLVE